MDLFFVTITFLWVFTESIMFFIQCGSATKIEPNGPRILYELDIDSNESFNFSCSSEADSGINSTSTEDSEISSCATKKLMMTISKEELIEFENRKKRAMVKRLARQERDRKQLKQYLLSKWTELESCQNGCEIDSEVKFMDTLDWLYNFVQLIRKCRIISLEDTALHFKLRPQEVVEHIKNLQSIGIISGVLDDRGKFIYVPETDSKAVGRFIQQQHLYHWPRKALI